MNTIITAKKTTLRKSTLDDKMCLFPISDIAKAGDVVVIKNRNEDWIIRCLTYGRSRFKNDPCLVFTSIGITAEIFPLDSNVEVSLLEIPTWEENTSPEFTTNVRLWKSNGKLFLSANQLDPWNIIQIKSEKTGEVIIAQVDLHILENIRNVNLDAYRDKDGFQHHNLVTIKKVDITL